VVVAFLAGIHIAVESELAPGAGFGAQFSLVGQFMLIGLFVAAFLARPVGIWTVVGANPDIFGIQRLAEAFPLAMAALIAVLARYRLASSSGCPSCSVWSSCRRRSQAPT